MGSREDGNDGFHQQLSGLVTSTGEADRKEERKQTGGGEGE